MINRTQSLIAAAIVAGAVTLSPLAASAGMMKGFDMKWGGGFSQDHKKISFGGGDFDFGNKFGDKKDKLKDLGDHLSGLLDHKGDKKDKFGGFGGGKWGDKDFNPNDCAPVPLPASLPLLLGGIGLLGAAKRRRMNK